MNKNLKVLAGAIILVVGAFVSWQSYVSVNKCSSLGGKVSTFISSLFGGNAAQACYNAQILEVGGILVAVIGLIVIFLALRKKGKK